MKIGINASFARKPNTGIGQVTLNFLRKLSELKVQSEKLKVEKLNFVLYLEEDLFADIKLPGNFSKRIFLPIYKRDDLIRKIWWEKYLLPRQVKKDGCDVLISLYQCPTIVSEKVKHIMLVHDIIPKLFPEYLNNFRKKLYWKMTEAGIKKAPKIIAVSVRTEKDLIQHLNISAEKITVNYIDADDAFKKQVSEKESARVLKKYKLKPGYILAGGGLEKRKNIEGVIHAYKLLLEKNKNLRFVPEMPKLVIYGKLLPQLAPLITDAEKLIKELNLTQQVKLLGMIPQKDSPAIFKNSLMFVYPSYYEGFGLPVLEAMNMGVPVIASKISSLPEVGLDSILYCHPGEIEDIAMVMKNVLENHALRETLKTRGRERAKGFSWGKFVKKVLNMVNDERRK